MLNSNFKSSERVESSAKFCMIAIDVARETNNKNAANCGDTYLSHIKDSLETFGNLLSTYPSTSNVSLLSIGSKPKVRKILIIKLQPVDIIQWKRGISKICLEDQKMVEPINIRILELLKSVRKVKDKYPGIKYWYLIVITSRIPEFDQKSIEFSLLCSLDAANVKIKFVLFQENQSSTNTTSDLHKYDLNHNSCDNLQDISREVELFSQFSILLRTTLVNSKIFRFQDSRSDFLPSFFKKIATKLIFSPKKLNKKVVLVLSRSFWICGTIFNTILTPTPSLAFNNVGHSPVVYKDLVQYRNEHEVLIGMSTIVSGLECFTSDDAKLVPPRVELIIVQRILESSLTDLSVKGPAIIMKCGSPSAMCTGTQKADFRENRRSFLHLLKQLSTSNQLLIVKTKWDLEQLEMSADKAYGLIDKFYVLYPEYSESSDSSNQLIQESIFYIKALVTRDELLEYRLEMGDSKQIEENGATTSPNNLLIELALDNTPLKDYNPMEFSTGFDSLVDKIAWDFASSVKCSRI